MQYLHPLCRFGKRGRKVAKSEKKIARLTHQCQLFSYRTHIKYMFGVRVPRNHKEALEIDAENGNTKWADSEELEVAELNSLLSFRSIGFKTAVPKGYKKIPIFFVYAVKETGRYKSRLVAGGHVLPPTLDVVYSGVVSLRAVCLICFVAELNDLKLMSSDISNAYLEAYNRDPIIFVAGPEFGDLEGHTMIVIMVITAVTISTRARETVHCNEPIRDWYFCVPSSSSSGVKSNSG